MSTTEPTHPLVSILSRRGRGATNRAGLVIALGVGAVFAGMIGFMMLRAPATPAGGGPAAPPADAPPVDVTDAPPGAGDVASSLVSGDGLNVKLVDRRDPNRLMGEIRSASIDPMDNGRYAVDRPEITVFFKDGRVLRIAAPSGSLSMPDRAREPESGTLSGGTIARLYEPSGGRPADPSGPPAVEARMDRLDFDTTLGELRTDDDIEVVGRAIRFTGEGLRLLYNEPLQRIELLEIARRGRVVYTPGADREPAPAAAEAAAPGAANTGGEAPSGAVAQPAPAGSPGDPIAPVETFYRAEFAGPVAASHRGARIEGGLMLLWLRTLDNRLAPGAIRAFDVGEPSTALRLPGGLARFGLGAGASPNLAEPVELSWEGKLRMVPTPERPAELDRQELAVRFERAAGGPVRFTDESSALDGFADRVAYGATTGAIRLDAGGPKGVEIRARERGTLLARDFALDLATGVGQVLGPGEVTADAGSPRPGNASWTEQADFTLRVADGRPTSTLREVMLAGDASAGDGNGSLRAGFVHATMADAPTDGEARIARLRASENVRAEDAEDGRLVCERMDVVFDDAPGGTRPAVMTAEGGVRVARDGNTLESKTLDVRFEPESEKSSRVRHVLATGGVRFADDQGVTADAEQLSADAVAQVVDLTGERVVLAKDRTRILTQQARLDGSARTMSVIGPGRFEHEQEGYAGPVVAEWTSSMLFDDRSGVITCDGDTRAEARRDAMSVDRLRAQRLRIEIDPASPEPKDGGAPEGERRLRRVLAESDVPPAPTGRTASAETRRTTIAGDFSDAAVDRVLYIESATLDLDAASERLRVPGPGRMFIRDLSSRAKDGAEAAAQNAAPALTGSGGDTLFDWQDSMLADRAKGEIEMLGRVRVTHAAPDSGEASFLESRRLLARANDPGRENPDGQPTLRSVLARGEVYGKLGARELAGDQVDYDAATRVVVLRADEGRSVTLYDPASATPLIARELWWDMASDRIEVRRPMPIVSPR